jgi:hypothetical protein
MANSSITFSWYDESANTTDIYVHEFNQSGYDRVIDAARRIFGTMNAETMTLELASRNKARKETSKESVRIWKDRARQEEIIVAQDGVAANIPPIDSTEV